MNYHETRTSPQIEFGLIAWLEHTRVKLPLKGVECRFNACGELLNVEMDQVFHQDNAQPLDCLYTFPLPAGAAVYRCEMHVNGRIIRAKVEEENRAREIVREKKAQGYRTALVEVERENLFMLSLGNVQPADVVVIRLAYFQTLTRLGDWTSFHIPFCPGIRYIPGQPLLRAPRGRGVADDTDQVPDASRISPPRIDTLHPDAAYLSVDGRVESPFGKVVEISSPSHPLWVRDGEGAFTIRLADGAAAPDKDLVMRWTEKLLPEVTPMGWVWRDGEDGYALLRLQGPPEAPVARDDFQDIYFLLDRSGSMQGLKWRKTAQAFREFLKSLGEGDRVWVTLFENQFRDFAEKPLPPAALLADPAVQRFEDLRTGGGTELLPALQHVLEKLEAHSAGRSAVLVLITDGQVGNEAEILHHLRQHPKVRTHTFGIDDAVNDSFLKEMAAQQHGTCYLVSPQDDIVGTVARLGQRLRRPVLTSIQVRGDWELADEKFPDLHAGEVLSLPVKGPGTVSELRIEGVLPDGAIKSFECKLIEMPEPALRLLWAQQRIAADLRNGKAAAALKLAKTHNLLCRGAAFVAWDEAEKVAISAPGQELYQPSFVAGVRKIGRGVQRDMNAYLCCMFEAESEPERRLQAKQVQLDRIAIQASQYPIQLPPNTLAGLSERERERVILWLRGLEEARVAGSVAHVPPQELFGIAEWWTDGILKQSLFREGYGRSILALLCQWALAEPAKWSERWAKLQELGKTLFPRKTWVDAITDRLRPNQDSEAPQGAAAIPLLRDWMRANLRDDAVRFERLDKMLTALEHPPGPVPAGGSK